MATGERRLGSSTRRGMTVLGKIPAVPKPINLPSQRLENRGLDPSVEIVPRGTFSWGTARSPPTTTSAWGNASLASSPPVTTGAWHSASTTASDSSRSSIAGLAEDGSRPLSAGGTRPSSAGSTRPLTASTTGNKTWGGATKLDEQVQPSRFNFTTVDFPTLGSEKSPNLRPQQHTTPLKRPTSADATNDWHSAHTGILLNRPTSADASKDRKPVQPGAVPADRPTSADATLKDKERHQSETRLTTFALSGDDNLPNNQRNIFYAGVVGHGPAGPGPGSYLPLKDNYNFHPPFVQRAMVSRGSHGYSVGPVMYPIVSQYDAFGNRLPPSNMENRPGVYGGYLAGVDHFNRPGVYQSHYSQHGPSEHISCGTVRVGPQPYGHEAIMLPEPPVTSERRDAFEVRDPVFEQQRVALAGRNLVHVGSPLDSCDNTPASLVATGTELQKPDTYVTPWGHEIEHSGWVITRHDDKTLGMDKEATSLMQQPSNLQETIPEGSRLEGSSECSCTESVQGGHTGDRRQVYHSNSSAMFSSQPLAPERVDELTDTPLVVERSGSYAPYGKYEIPVKRKEAAGRGMWVSGSLRSGRGSQPSGSGLGAGTSGDKPKLGEVANKEQLASDQESVPVLDESGGLFGQAPEMSSLMLSSKGSKVAPQEQLASQTPQPVEEEEGESSVSRSKQPVGMAFGLKVATQRLEDTTQRNQQIRVKHDDDGFADSSKSALARKRFAASRRSLKKDGLPSSVSHDTEGATSASDKCLSSAAEGNTVDGGTSSSQMPSVHIPSQVEVTTGSNMNCDDTVQMQTHSQIEHKASDEHTIPAQGPGPALSEAEPGTSLIPAPVEEGQALNDNMPHRKMKRNSYTLKRGHQSRNEPHDKHNANECLVWAPRKALTTGEDVKEEAHPSSQKVGSLPVTSSKDDMVCVQQNQSTESDKRAEQVQQMQSAASAHQEQWQQTQQPSVAGGRKEADETQHYRAADINSGKKGLSTSSMHREREKLTKPRESLASCDGNLRMETSDLEQRGSLEVERNVQIKEFVPAEDHQVKDYKRRPVPAPRKSKDASTIYVPRPARHLQWQRQEEEQLLHQGQRHLSKGERVGSKDAEVFAALIDESGKNEDGKAVKHQEVYKHNFLLGERQVPTPETRLQAERLEHRSSSATGPEMVKDDQNTLSSNKQKLARQHEMLKKKSPAGRHQERSIIGAQEHGNPEAQTRASNTTQSSPIKREMQIYVPKAARKQQQESVASDGEGQKQVQGSRKDPLAEELQQCEENLQCSSIDKRNGMESSALKPARQQKIQRQHSTTGGHPQPRSSDSDEQTSSSLEGLESKLECKLKTVAISDPGGSRNDIKVNTTPHFGKNKKELKYFVPKPQQQQYVPQGDQGDLSQERSERSPKVSRNGPSKKREEIERYTPKPARQLAAIASQADDEGNKGVSSGVLEQWKGGNDRASEHNIKSYARSQEVTRSQLKDDPKEASEQEHPKDGVLPDSGPKLRQQGGIKESLLIEDSAKQNHTVHYTKMREHISNPGYQKRQYHYQPVNQQLSASKTEQRDSHVVNVDHGQNRYGRRDGPARRGRKYGHGYSQKDPYPTS